MNNGQPPYGDPSAWGQQGNQANPGQYPVQQNPYVQHGMAGYSQPFQPVETYQQQAHPQQQTYQQQNWQPYQPQQGYQQPQQPYCGQMNGQQAYQQVGYQQNNYQQTGYQQQPQQAYPQFNQMGQQMPQQGYTGYTGYHSQPAEKHFEIPFDLVAKVFLFGVLPVLFILALVLGVPALKWVFLGGAVAGIILMWMKDVVSPNLRLTTTLVLGVMAVVALVGALSGNPATGNNHGNANAGQNMVQQQNQGNIPPQDLTTPTLEPTATPAPQDAAEDAVEQLMSFFYFWSVGNDEAMLSLTAPSWRNSVENPASALFVLLLNRTPQDDYEVTSITPGDAMRTATVKVTINKNDGRASMDRYAFKVIMKKEDNVWYVDPQSLASNEKETATQTVASANTTPTQPPLYTGTPTTVLYYNANGGSMYHLDPDCRSVGAKYKPMAQFMFTELSNAPYNALRPCNQCGAPIPDD